MSTRAFSSTVVAAPIDSVWKVLRDFTFPAKVFADRVESVNMLDGACGTSVGGVREVAWKNGEKRRHKLMELSDHHHTITWELHPNENPEEVVSPVSAIVTTVQLYRVTRTNSTFVSWSSDFSSDVVGRVILEEQQDYAANLTDLEKFFKQ